MLQDSLPRSGSWLPRSIRSPEPGTWIWHKHITTHCQERCRSEACLDHSLRVRIFQERKDRLEDALCGHRNFLETEPLNTKRSALHFASFRVRPLQSSWNRSCGTSQSCMAQNRTVPRLQAAEALRLTLIVDDGLTPGSKLGKVLLGGLYLPSPPRLNLVTVAKALPETPSHLRIARWCPALGILTADAKARRLRSILACGRRCSICQICTAQHHCCNEGVPTHTHTRGHHTGTHTTHAETLSKFGRTHGWLFHGY